jgi:transposase-like protein
MPPSTPLVRRKYSPEFKAELVAICQQPGVSVSAAALANGLNANQLWRWINEHKTGTGWTAHRPHRLPVRYSAEFRQTVIEASQQPGATKASVARAYGLSSTQIRRWIDKFAPKPPTTPQAAHTDLHPVVVTEDSPSEAPPPPMTPAPQPAPTDTATPHAGKPHRLARALQLAAELRSSPPPVATKARIARTNGIFGTLVREKFSPVVVTEDPPPAAPPPTMTPAPQPVSAPDTAAPRAGTRQTHRKQQPTPPPAGAPAPEPPPPASGQIDITLGGAHIQLRGAGQLDALRIILASLQ